MKFLVRQTIYYIVLLQTVFLVAGCSGISYLSAVGLGSSNMLREVTIESTVDSNHDNPVALDLLFIYDPTLMPVLTSLTGPEWFAQKNQLLLSYQQKILIAGIEVVPLSVRRSVELPKGHKNAKNVLLFVNYLAVDGQDVAELSDYNQLKIVLERERYQLVEMNKALD